MIRLRKLFPAWSLPADHDDDDDSLHSVDRINAILERERLRSDRGNSSFALLTLTLFTPYETRDLISLARVIHRRIRVTDDAGRLAPRQIGIVLPETHADGAWKLVEDLCGLLPRGMPCPECDVYTYPTHPSNGESADAATKGKPAQNGKAAHRGKRRDARPMHLLFVRPLPTWKRAMDVMGASVALLLAAPLMLLVAVIIKLTSPGPIIFTQKRDTIGGRQFTI